MSAEIAARLAGIEQRLARLETAAGRGAAPAQRERPRAEPPAPEGPPPANEKLYPARARYVHQEEYVAEPQVSWSVTRILGWGGATALVLAAAYLIRLAIVDGWLTPTRQVAFAVMAGFALIAAGIRLRKIDREYASLLPAGGIVILFLSTYGAHLYYELISVTLAGVAVMAICAGSLVLCQVFHSQLYAFFAVIGSYSAPAANALHLSQSPSQTR